MNFGLQPWQFCFAVVAGWVNREQQQALEYVQTENAVLKELHGTKRLLLNDDQRRRLAVKGKLLGRKLMEQVGTLFTPDTILRWHRRLVAEKWNHADKRKCPGRPAVSQEVAELVLKFARENPTWGYDRIARAIAPHCVICNDWAMATSMTCFGEARTGRVAGARSPSHDECIVRAVGQSL